MRKLARRLSLVVLVLAVCVPAFGAGGSKKDEPEAAVKTPEQQAAEYYNAGLADRDQAWKLQMKAADPELAADKRAKIETKVRRAYEQAIKNFTRALESDPSLHEAWSSLGYAYRQTGDHATALEAYQQALSIKADYPEALEYLGEALLGLNRIADAQKAYERLQTVDKKLANELLGAMHAWIARRRAEPKETKVGELDALERWVGDRLEGAPAASSLGKSRSW